MQSVHWLCAGRWTAAAAGGRKGMGTVDTVIRPAQLLRAGGGSGPMSIDRKVDANVRLVQRLARLDARPDG